MTSTVGPKGQVVIPKPIRDALGINPGDKVTFLRDQDHVEVRRVEEGSRLRGRFRATGLVSDLAHEREAERNRGR